MRFTRRTNAAALLMLGLLAACGEMNSGNNMAATETSYEQLSQLQWMEMTAAPTTAKVNNNFLIMMR